jgi:hypothetical protein
MYLTLKVSLTLLQSLLFGRLCFARIIVPKLSPFYSILNDVKFRIVKSKIRILCYRFNRFNLVFISSLLLDSLHDNIVNTIKIINACFKPYFVLIQLKFLHPNSNSSALHNSGKNILRWYLGCMYFPITSSGRLSRISTMLNIFYSNVQMLHNQVILTV